MISEVRRRNKLRRRLVLGSVIALTGLMVTLGLSLQYSEYRTERMRLVLGNALQVTSPEYLVRRGPYTDVERTPISLSLLVPARALGNELESTNIRLAQSPWGRLIGAAQLPAKPMTAVLAKFRGGTGESVAEKSKAKTAIIELADNSRPTAIVELVNSLSEADFRRSVNPKLSRDDDEFILLSPIQETSGKPLYWWSGFDNCGDGTLRNCDKASSVGQFREWVSLLRGYDEPNLRKFGLTLSALRHAAEEANVYGFILSWSTKGQLLHFLNNPEVRTIRLVPDGK
ncbi:hypothetical protein Aple_052370 [Acrocarpospora pleiomorpha]|uniref:Uncharacterized protein n=1 Tax=Acrocarpospora pleiomorpha TaxID=90975 RepID=A0A5M3XN18_9ACTN|nr:hypothetical protein [Acrocarpospora pleiomorpha]GES22340.1 hypothetical protein Aple_052370 [Acrocarpospora pleiomorpha]